jgi:hypothetical protein
MFLHIHAGSYEMGVIQRQSAILNLLLSKKGGSKPG